MYYMQIEKISCMYMGSIQAADVGILDNLLLQALFHLIPLLLQA